MAKYIGLQYPLVKTPRGTMAQKKGVDQIKADLLQLLLTNPGERVMMPEYGTPLKDLMFDQNDTILELRAKQMIAQSILQWEPRVVIENIEVSSKVDTKILNKQDTKDEAESILTIKVKFIDPENISIVESLVLEKPLGA